MEGGRKKVWWLLMLGKLRMLGRSSGCDVHLSFGASAGSIIMST